MRLIFMGSPAFALPTLAALIEAGHDIICVYSQAPKPAGRGKAVRETPVHTFAKQQGIEVRTPSNLKLDDEKTAFRALNADAAIVVAYGLILPKAILDAPKLGCFNLHGSLLPRWRGAAPMQRAIEAGDTTTGVQVMAMEVGLDTGGVYATATTPIGDADTTGTLHDRLAVLGADLMVASLPQIAGGTLACIPQADGGITYATKIDRTETRIDWNKPAIMIDRCVRAFAPFPGAWCILPDGSRAKVLLTQVEAGSVTGSGSEEAAVGTTIDPSLLIACGEDALRILKLQREGKGVMDARDFLRGSAIKIGEIFT